MADVGRQAEHRLIDVGAGMPGEHPSDHERVPQVVHPGRVAFSPIRPAKLRAQLPEHPIDLACAKHLPSAPTQPTNGVSSVTSICGSRTRR